METTNDGFTFRRVSTNKVERVEMKCRSMEPRAAKSSAFEMGGFTFRKVGKQAAGRPGVTVGLAHKAPSQPDGAGGTDRSSTAHGKLVSKTAKKRRTIQMEECLDLSTDSEKDVSTSSPKDLYAGPAAAPVAVKSSEIHKRVADGNINSLVKECVRFLKDDSPYAYEISTYCNGNYFSDIDYRRDIESTQARIDAVQSEISKWNRIYEERSGRTEVGSLPGALYSTLRDRELFDPTSIIGEFRGKAERLRELEGRIAYFLEGAKAKSEVILKNIFGAVENRTVDALFVLKAMSKLGK